MEYPTILAKEAIGDTPHNFAGKLLNIYFVVIIYMDNKIKVPHKYIMLSVFFTYISIGQCLLILRYFMQFMIMQETKI